MLSMGNEYQKIGVDKSPPKHHYTLSSGSSHIATPPALSSSIPQQKMLMQYSNQSKIFDLGAERKVVQSRQADLVYTYANNLFHHVCC